MHLRAQTGVPVVALLSILSCGCPSTQSVPTKDLNRIGETVQVGSLIYTVVESEWKSQLGGGGAQQIPNHRFMLIRVTVTNSGGAEITLPTLTLEGSSGASYPAATNGAGVPEWLGMLRKIAPAETVDGRVLFDVPTGAYKLRVPEASEPGQEKSALIDIPLRLDPEIPTAPVPAK